MAARRISYLVSLIFVAFFATACFAEINTAVDHSGDLVVVDVPLELADEAAEAAPGCVSGLFLSTCATDQVTGQVVSVDLQAERVGDCSQVDSPLNFFDVEASGSLTLLDESGATILSSVIDSAACLAEYSPDPLPGTENWASGSFWGGPDGLNVYEVIVADEATLIANGVDPASAAEAAGATYLSFNSTAAGFQINGILTEVSDPLTEARQIWQDAFDSGEIGSQATYNAVVNSLERYEARVGDDRPVWFQKAALRSAKLRIRIASLLGVVEPDLRDAMFEQIDILLAG